MVPQVPIWAIPSFQVPFNEQRLCRLFLNASTSHFKGYQPPLAPSGAPNLHRKVIPALLELDPALRMDPKQLHDFYWQQETVKDGSYRDVQAVGVFVLDIGRMAMKELLLAAIELAFGWRSGCAIS